MQEESKGWEEICAAKAKEICSRQLVQQQMQLKIKQMKRRSNQLHEYTLGHACKASIIEEIKKEWINNEGEVQIDYLQPMNAKKNDDAWVVI